MLKEKSIVSFLVGYSYLSNSLHVFYFILNPHQYCKSDMAKRTKESMRKAGKKGGEATKTKNGPSFYKRIGQKGGTTTREKLGEDFYRKIGQKGGLKSSKRHTAK